MLAAFNIQGTKILGSPAIFLFFEPIFCGSLKDSHHGKIESSINKFLTGFDLISMDDQGPTRYFPPEADGE